MRNINPRYLPGVLAILARPGAGGDRRMSNGAGLGSEAASATGSLVAADELAEESAAGGISDRLTAASESDAVFGVRRPTAGEARGGSRPVPLPLLLVLL